MADVVIVGAGPAGLATARELARRGIRARLLERGERLGHTWANLYDSLTLHTGKHMSGLPGLAFPRSTPVFPSRLDFLDYLERYADRFELEVETGMAVTGARPPNGGSWQLTTPSGPIEARAIVFATGIVANPVLPEIPGREAFRGRVLHSIDYRRPDPFIGRSVLVVGVGNSGGEIGAELSRAGARVTIAVRSGANVVPLAILGVPIQYIAYGLRSLPEAARRTIAIAVGRMGELRRGPPVLPRPEHGPLDAIPLIGFHLVDEIRAGRVAVAPGIERFTARGVRFTDARAADFDDVILATGFRPALDALHGIVRVNTRGFALRTDRITSADRPGLFFVGHNYDATGGLMNIARDAPLAADRVAALLSGAKPYHGGR